MPIQRCSVCDYPVDVGPYISGKKIPCPGCGLTLEVVRNDVSQLRAARPGSRVGVPSVPPAPAAKAAGAEAAVAIAVPVAEAAPAESAVPNTPSPGLTEARPPPSETVSPPPASATTGPESLPPPVASAPVEDDSTVVRHAVQVPGYALVQVVGRGGMGEVWQARQLSLGREVALKILAPNLASDPDFVKRFEKEAAALAALSHPGIVQIIDRGQFETLSYFVMEFVHGQSLRELMDDKKVGPSEAMKIVCQIGAAIDYAHARGIIHRDLKPENILVDAEGRVKVADFGLAGIRDEKFNVTRTAMTMGTVNYMAPEQRKDAKAVDGRADIYSLGVILYELLCGEVPMGRFRLPSERVAGLDSRVDQIIAKALEPEADARYARASEMVHVLEAMLSTISLPAHVLPDASPPRPLTPLGIGAPQATPTGQATRPDSPANLETRLPAEPEPEQPAVVVHVRRAGRALRHTALASMVLLGALALVTLITGKPILNVDETGLSLWGNLLVINNPRYHPDAGLPAEALPVDHDGDVDITVDRSVVGPGEIRLSSGFAPGQSGSLIAMDGAWEATDGGLVGRVFDRLESQDRHPRATLEEPSFDPSGLVAEVTVALDPTPPRGYAPRTPRAVLFFRSPQLLLELSMETGPAPVYRLITKTSSHTDTSGDAEFNQVAPPKGGEPVTLRLTLTPQGVVVLADNVPVFDKAISLDRALLTQPGRIGMACEEATCRFTDLSITGRPTTARPLLPEEKHQHVVSAR